MNQTEFDKLDEEMSEIAVQEKPIEQFRQEMIDGIFQAVTKETGRSTSFMKKADYYNAKRAEAKIEGLHQALSIILEVSTVVVKEGGGDTVGDN